MTRPAISAVIPTLSGGVDALCGQLLRQTWPPEEIQVVQGVRPPGRARNQGVSRTRGDCLVFVDDDARLGQPDLIEQMVRPLLEQPAVGVTGVARVLPAEANWFQRRVAAEIPRTVNQVPASPLLTNPPLSGFGHSLITTTCCALRRPVFEEAGGFDERLTSGCDSDLFYRIRKLGYDFLMVPGRYVTHPAPASLGALVRKFYWYGQGHGQEAQGRPIGLRLPTAWHRAAFLLASTLWLLPNMVILYSYGYPYWHIGFRPFKAISTYAAAWGYVRGWQGKVR